MGAAETGSGKTLAFGIPLLTGILELKKRNTKCGIRNINSKEQKEIENKRNNERENFTPPPEELQYYPEIDDDGDDEDKIDEIGKDKPLYALILTPTRELAVQIKDHIVSVAKYTGKKTRHF